MCVCVCFQEMARVASSIRWQKHTHAITVTVADVMDPLGVVDVIVGAPTCYCVVILVIHVLLLLLLLLSTWLRRGGYRFRFRCDIIPASAAAFLASYCDSIRRRRIAASNNPRLFVRARTVVWCASYRNAEIHRTKYIFPSSSFISLYTHKQTNRKCSHFAQLLLPD